MEREGGLGRGGGGLSFCLSEREEKIPFSLLLRWCVPVERKISPPPPAHIFKYMLAGSVETLCRQIFAKEQMKGTQVHTAH